MVSKTEWEDLKKFCSDLKEENIQLKAQVKETKKAFIQLQKYTKVMVKHINGTIIPKINKQHGLIKILVDREISRSGKSINDPK